MYVKEFIVYLNRCLKPFLLVLHISIVNTVTIQSKSAKIENRYNQVPHLTKDIFGLSVMIVNVDGLFKMQML